MYLLDGCLLNLIERFSRKPQNKVLLEDIRLFIKQFSKLKEIYFNAYSVEPHWDQNIRYLWIFRDLLDFATSLYPLSNGKLDFTNRGYVNNVVSVWSFHETDMNVIKRMTVLLFGSFTVKERDEYIKYTLCRAQSKLGELEFVYWDSDNIHPDARDL